MMDKKYIDSLAHRFPSLSRAEIEQACLLAELRTGNENIKLAYTMVKCACINRLEHEKMMRSYFCSYDIEKAPEEMMGVEDTFVTEMERRQEWETTLSKLPKKARTLARIAQEEAQAFALENTMRSVWTRKGLDEMRQRIKRRFLKWEWTHSQRAYYKARRCLLNAMHRHERETRNRRKER